MINEFAYDLYFSIRRLVKAQLYTATVALTFAFCLGPCTLLFNIFNSLYLDPDRYPEEDRVIRIYDEFSDVSLGEKRRGTNQVLYTERKEQSKYLDSISIQAIDHLNVQAGETGTPEFSDVLMVSPSFFDVIKVNPFLGRRFYESDIGLGSSAKVVILTYGWWQTRFNGDEFVVGRSLIIDGQPWEVVGVMPQDFAVPPFSGRWDMASIGVIIPHFISQRDLESHDRFRSSPLGCLARLKPGVSRQMIEMELASLNVKNAEKYPEFKNFLLEHPLTTHTMSVGEDQIRDLESTFLLTAIMVIFVLLAGALSIANFVSSRNSSRIQEFAIRASLGASKSRLLQQLFIENLIFVLIGVGLSLYITKMGLVLLNQWGMFSFFPMIPSLEISGSTLLVAMSLSLLMGGICLFVSAPLLIARSQSLGRKIKADSRTGSDSSSIKNYRAALILLQSAIAFVLLVNGILLTRSFIEILNIDPGYQTDKVFYTTIRPPDDRYTNEERFNKMIALEKNIQALPGVEAAGVSNWPPMKHPNISQARVVSFEDPDIKNAVTVPNDRVSPGYFKALNIKPARGRLFNDGDVINETPSVIIDKILAEQLFPETDPIGKRIALFHPTRPPSPEAVPQWQTIIGIVNPVRINDLYTPAEGMVYRHVGGRRLYWFGFVVKVKTSSKFVVQKMQELLANVEPGVAVGQPSDIDRAIAGRYSERQKILYFCIGLAVVALALAILGVSGVISYSISAQKKEIGIRLALGAKPNTITHSYALYWLRLVGIGSLAGIIISIAISGKVSSLLYNVNALDLSAYFFAAIIFLGIITIAAYASAKKASVISPLDAVKDW